jgi:hypothetical protein
MPGPLTRRVIQLCDDALATLQPGEGHDLVSHVRTTLDEPLRVAVAGSISSGKSTLVNALLHQKVATVDAGECTKLVTWYTYDHQERIDVVRRDGSRLTLPTHPSAGLPDDLGVPSDEVKRIEVLLSNENLRNVTIIDTPGLDTVTEENQAATTQLLGLVDGQRVDGDSKVAMADADALIFLMPHVHKTDADVLGHFRDLFRGTGLSAINAVGLLSKIDKLTSGDDPWPTARRIVERVKGDLRSIVSDLVPVIGLLAETSACDQFTEHDARALRELAQLDELDREDLLLSQSDFLNFSSPQIEGVSREQRLRLLRMLDLYGIAQAFEAIDGGAKGAGALLDRWDEVSGFSAVTQIVEGVFARRADLLKTHAGMASLRRISFLESDPDNRAALAAMRSPLEQLELDADMHDLRVLEVLHTAYRGEMKLTDELLADLERLALHNGLAERLGLAPGATLTELTQAAALGAGRWATYNQDSRRKPQHRRMARDVKQAFELLYQQAAAAP